MKLTNELPETNCQSVATALTKLLADENVLYIKTKKAHWNVEGADFYDKHLFFESQFTELNQIIDLVAERIRMVGHYATASLYAYLELTQLTERTSEKNSSHGFIRELLEDHECIIISLQENIKSFGEEYDDAGSCDFITATMEKHQKMAWFLRSHLKN